MTVEEHQRKCDEKFQRTSRDRFRAWLDENPAVQKFGSSTMVLIDVGAVTHPSHVAELLRELANGLDFESHDAKSREHYINCLWDAAHVLDWVQGDHLTFNKKARKA